MEQEQLEITILKHLVQNEEAKTRLIRKQTGLSLNYFQKIGSCHVAEWIVSYANKYKDLPANVTILIAFASEKINRLEEPTLNWCRQLAESIFEPPQPPETFQFCVDLLVNNWVKKTSIDKMRTAAETLEKDNLDKFTDEIKEMTRSVISVRETLPNTDPIKDYDRLLAEHQYLASHKELFVQIPSGLEWLDKKFGGGWVLGEYYLLFAYTGRGKSFFGTQCAFNAAWEGFNVAVANLEMTDKKATNRMLSRITGIPIERFIKPWLMTEENYETWDEKINFWKDRKGSLTFLTFERAPTVEQIEAKLHDLPIMPDFLIVDQITNMSTRLEWQELEVIAKGFEILAKGWNKGKGLAVLTFGQAKTETKWLNVLSEKHFAYGKPVVDHATSVLYLAQEKDEYKLNLIRLGMCKNRDGERVLSQWMLYPDQGRGRIDCEERVSRECKDGVTRLITFEKDEDEED